MTKAQRIKHVVDLNGVLREYGYEEDRWGTFRKGRRKIDTRKNNLKVSVRSASGGYMKVLSTTLSKVSPDELGKKLKLYEDRGYYS